MLTRLLTLCVFLLLLIVPAAASSNAEVWPWPGAVFRGDFNRTGQSPLEGPSEGALAWKFHTGDRIVADAAIGLDGSIYVASLDGNLYCIDSAGRLKWKYQARIPLWATPAVGPDGTIYQGTDRGTLVALSAEGLEKWVFKIAPIRGEPNLDDVDTSPIPTYPGTVFLAAGKYIYALGNQGEPVWRYGLKKKVFSSPAMGGDGIIRFGTQGQGLFALDHSGSSAWHVEYPHHADATPLIDDGGNTYFGTDSGEVIAVSRDGKVLWKASLAGPVRAPLGLSRTGDVLAAASGEDSALYSLDAASGKTNWAYTIDFEYGSLHGISSGPLIDAGGHIFFGARDGRLRALSPAGHHLWSYNVSVDIDTGPVLHPDGLLLIGADDGNLYAFR